MRAHRTPRTRFRYLLAALAAGGVLVVAGPVWALAALLAVSGLLVLLGPSARPENEDRAPARATSAPASLVDRMILERDAARQREVKTRAEEAETWPQLEANAPFNGRGPIRIRFDDLARTAPLLARAIRRHIDTVGPLRPNDPAVTARGDAYRIRTDGRRFDVRRLQGAD